MKILGIDPGINTGVAILTVENNEVIKETLKTYDLKRYTEFLKMLIIAYEKPTKSFNLQFVVEDYLLDPTIPQGGSRLETVRVIGKTEFVAELIEAPLAFQLRNIKVQAQRMSGRTPEGNHALSHVVDAYNHAYYWGVMNGHIRKERKIYNGFN